MWSYPLGTDDLGRDLLSRLLHGGRVSLGIAFLGLAAGAFLGVPIGLISGYYGGRVDAALMRILDGLLSFPTLLLALFITSLLGPGLVNLVAALGLAMGPRLARFTRGQAIAVRGNEYVQASRALGQRDSRLMSAHILPNIAGALIIQGSVELAYAVLLEASLSFLGLGLPPPTASWGTMLRREFGNLISAPWLAMLPGLFISAAVLGANLLGDSLRDVLDPRSRAK